MVKTPIRLLIVWGLLIQAVQASELLRGTGGAEISSYQTLQPRYGEARPAYTVMVFVTEDLNVKTRVKPDDYRSLRPKERLPVLKLNRVLQFNTGVYNYAVMTSVFSSTTPFAGKTGFSPAKISISATEWCGNFYSHLLPDAGGAKRVMHSYFEKEGDVSDYIPAPENSLYEDNLPILIRELKGPFMKIGEAREYRILPALWASRVSHRPLTYLPGKVSKQNGPVMVFKGKERPTFEWTWSVGNRSETYWVEAELPGRILRWQSSSGEKGEIVESMMVRYWDKNRLRHENLRRKLGLPDGPEADARNRGGFSKNTPKPEAGDVEG